MNEESSNSSDGGGAIAISKNSIFTVYIAGFTNNTSGGDGGAIKSIDSYVVMENAYFADNSADVCGGAIDHEMETFTDIWDDYFFKCTNCAFEQNQAKKLGGIYVYFKLDVIK